MRKIAAVIATMVVLVSAAVAAGFDQLNAGIQLRGAGKWDEAFSAFDQALAAGDLTPNQQFIAHIDRAEAALHLRRIDVALEDYSAALKLQPASPFALFARANVYRTQKKYDLAAADLDAMVAARPDVAAAYNFRSRLSLLRGEVDKAREDLHTMLSFLPDQHSRMAGILQWQLGQYDQARDTMSSSLDKSHDLYSWLWMALVDAHGGKLPPRRDLPDYDKSKWPAPIVSYFLGDIALGELTAQAMNAQGGEAGVEGRSCEADFYAGELLLQRHDTAAGASMIRKAAMECPTNFVEWSPAQLDVAGLP
jgi:lipoprotein NlpI